MESLRRGTGVESHGRSWHVGPLEAEGELTFGQIGFERPGEPATVWDQVNLDFHPVAQTQGHTSRFVVDFPRGRVAFQVRPGQIEPYGFASAFRALLNEAAPAGWRWQVEVAVLGLPWERWVESVDRITEISFTLEEPNPSYGDRTEVKRIIAGIRAAKTRVVASVPENADHGIDANSQLIRQGVEHARLGYGTWRATAVSKFQQLVKWVEKQDGQPVQLIGDPDDAGNPTKDTLRRGLDEPEAENVDGA